MTLHLRLRLRALLPARNCDRQHRRRGAWFYCSAFDSASSRVRLQLLGCGRSHGSCRHGSLLWFDPSHASLPPRLPRVRPAARRCAERPPRLSSSFVDLCLQCTGFGRSDRCQYLASTRLARQFPPRHLRPKVGRVQLRPSIISRTSSSASPLLQPRARGRCARRAQAGIVALLAQRRAHVKLRAAPIRIGQSL